METTTTVHEPLDRRSRPLRRSLNGRMVAGVAVGVADYLDVDVVVVRVLLVVLALAGGLGVPLYVAAWLLVPGEGADETIAEHVLEELRR